MRGGSGRKIGTIQSSGTPRAPVGAVRQASAPERISGGAARTAANARELAGWWRGAYVPVALAVATAVAFIALAFAAQAGPYFEVDLLLMRALQSIKHPILDLMAGWISWPGYPPQSNILFGALILLLVVRRHLVAAVGQLLAAGGSALLWFGIAPLVNRPRPSPDLVHVSAELPYGSFPSGHVLNLTAGFGFAWYLAYTLLPPSAVRTLVLWLVPIYLVVLGVARVYEGQHWPSDILGGFLLGALWLWLCITTYRWLEKVRGVGRERRRQTH
jgi:membrane-associated phospholipid phosphatase